MIDYYSLPESSLPMSMRALRRILQKRGWKAEKITPNALNDLILTRPDGKELRIASSTPPTTTVFALHLADNKLASYALLADLDVPQPETVAVKSQIDAERLLQKYGEIVVKPIDGAHGNGVTVGITDIDELPRAIKKAEMASQNLGLAIAQAQLPSNQLEIRVICIDYKFVVAFARIPAHVTGDGQHTLLELIERENATIRTEPYTDGLAYIDVEMAKTYLGGRASEVPEAGASVQVIASCNVGQGGTVRDYSAEFSEEKKILSEKIAQAAKLPVIGIDFYGDNVLEFNACPSLYYPADDDSATRAVEAYVEYLEKL